MTPSRGRDLYLAGGILALGVWLSLRYGGQGLMPLDQSIVFDGGWRVLSGQVPYRDFGTPAGLLPILLQAVSFALFGVSWSSYLGHAALVNGLYGVVAYALLRALRANPLLSAGCAGASVWLLYPPIGTPYPEQHAFFFVLLACAAGAWAARANSARAAAVGWALLGAVWWLAVLCKLNAAAVGALPVLCTLLLGWPRPRAWLRRLGWAVAGGLAAVVATAGAVAAFGVDPEMLRLYAFDLPLEAGQGRLGRFELTRAFGRLLRAPVLSPHAIPDAIVLAALAVGWSRRRGRPVGELRDAAGAALLAVALLVSSALFLGTAANQTEIGLAPIFVSLALAGHALVLVLPGRVASSIVFVAVGAIIVADTLRFHREVVVPRSVLDMEFDPATATRMRTLGLESMQHQAPHKTPVKSRDLERLLTFLGKRSGNFLLIGDHSILYGLSGRPSLPPSLWFHAGLAHPGVGHPARRQYEAALVDSLDSSDGGARWVIVEGEETWMGTRLADLAGLEQRLVRPPMRIGAFQIYGVREPAAAAAAP